VTTATTAGLPALPVLPVLPSLESVLPGGLPRGQTVTVSGSVSLLLALLAGPSADGAWCALVDLPPRAPGAVAVNAEALAGLGLVLDRVVVVRAPAGGWSRASWVTTVGALVDAFDVVAVRPETRPAAGDVQRLAARVRSRGAVLVPYLTGGQSWPGGAIRLRAEVSTWSGLEGDGGGRLRRRQTTVVADRRGHEIRPRTASLWLPGPDGAVGSDASPALGVVG
jgi:hypothetical protein